ncbi:hypothetical protein CALVIDRAFT_14388 [Calocera viscosa TUFC12733]|uniref:Uncharacterized protein n=1 Tax=Calocera viscosa (strain TUFC12733) TaxID=1330018 RepID=A0A167S7W0_CALVF|nr:hypothetical protein CALVIDRAFT_14388 [Calocera viscosa TUFC12733]
MRLPFSGRRSCLAPTGSVSQACPSLPSILSFSHHLPSIHNSPPYPSSSLPPVPPPRRRRRRLIFPLSNASSIALSRPRLVSEWSWPTTPCRWTQTPRTPCSPDASPPTARVRTMLSMRIIPKRPSTTTSRTPLPLLPSSILGVLPLSSRLRLVVAPRVQPSPQTLPRHHRLHRTKVSPPPLLPPMHHPNTRCMVNNPCITVILPRQHLRPLCTKPYIRYRRERPSTPPRPISSRRSRTTVRRSLRF